MSADGPGMPAKNSMFGLAKNEFGVGVRPQTYLPFTKTMHGIGILVPSGGVIGRIQSWKATFGERDAKLLYEVNPDSWGRPIDNIPGIESGRKISCGRVEVWGEEIETVFMQGRDTGWDAAMEGTNSNFSPNALEMSEWRDLCEQTRPFCCIEVLYRGTQIYSGWSYHGCWFTSKGLTEYGAESEAKIQADVEMQFVIRHNIAGSLYGGAKVAPTDGVNSETAARQY